MLPASLSWYLKCYVKGGADLFLYGCVSRPFDTFSSIYDFADSWLSGSLGCGFELDLNSLIPSETTDISGSLPPACNEMFGKNKIDVDTKDTNMQKSCVFTQIIIT